MAEAIVVSTQLQLEIFGLIKEHSFQIAQGIAEGLKNTFPEEFLDPKMNPLLEFDWHLYLYNKKRELRGELWLYSSTLMCLLNGRLLGDDQDLARWAKKEWEFIFNQSHACCVALTEESYAKYLYDTGHPFVFLDIEIRGELVGRLLFELFSDVCPKTCKNFQALCTGEMARSQSGLMLYYKGSAFHRVVPNGWIQGGDISLGAKGDGGESIYGPIFEDESFAIPHSRRGILGMANQGPHSNGSQFYITLQPAPWMDGDYVAFGQLVEGIDVLKRLEEAPTYNERPKHDCRVADCGVFVP